MTRLRRICAHAALLLLAACASAPPAPGPVSWRVASYNIHAGIGMDRAVDLERVARVLEPLDADVIALQEVDERVRRSGEVDQAARLAELLGMHHVFGPAMDFQGGRYGIALLSRYPITGSEVIRLPDGREPRVALAITVARAGAPEVTFVGLHIDHVANDTLRYAQATALAQWLDARASPWVLAGDFNDEPGSRTLALFHARALDARKPEAARLTFPSVEPVKEIDFIFAAPRGDWRIAEVRVIDERVASDHRPVFAVLVHAPAN